MPEETATKGLAPFLKELRKVIPDPIKIPNRNNPMYSVGGKLIIELNYYCSWRSADDKEKEKTCFPASVTIKVDGDAIAKLIHGSNTGLTVSGNSVYRVRTIQVNELKPLVETLKRISVAVNKALSACESYVVRFKEQRAKEEAFRKSYKARCEAIHKEIGHKSLQVDTDGVSSRLYNRRAGKIHVDINLYPRYFNSSNKPEYLDLEVHHLTPEQFKNLIPVIKEVLNAKAPESGSN
jgi:hypothetical protein